MSTKSTAGKIRPVGAGSFLYPFPIRFRLSQYNREDLTASVEVAEAVRKGAAASMDKLALHLVRDRLSETPEAGTCNCC
jgi:hypothetical protein